MLNIKHKLIAPEKLISLLRKGLITKSDRIDYGEPVMVHSVANLSVWQSDGTVREVSVVNADVGELQRRVAELNEKESEKGSTR